MTYYLTSAKMATLPLWHWENPKFETLFDLPYSRIEEKPEKGFRFRDIVFLRRC